MRTRRAAKDLDRMICLGAVVEAGTSYGAAVTVSAALAALSKIDLGQSDFSFSIFHCRLIA